jgi:penicillin-binding protein 1B
MIPGGAEVFLRSFRYPEYRSHAGRVRVHMSRGRVDSLVAIDLLTEEECKLEPERIASFEGSTGAFQNPLRLETAPPLLVDALIEIEDRRFLKHPGIDPIGSLRALWFNLRIGERAQGGSTLTQQLARSLYLHNQKTITRKLQEAIYAIGLELRYSKRQILEAYLNAIYWGTWGTMEIRGAREAARYYLGCELEETDDAGIALLVSLIRAPNSYSPYASPQRARRRRDMVLRLLYDRGILSEERTRAGFATPLPTERPPDRIADPSYFIDAARREIAERAPAGTLERNGITVFTTLDPYDQASAVIALREGLESLESDHRRLRRRGDPLQAAVVSLDPSSGCVRALVGGRDYLRGPWNRAIDAQRQPGSLFKPFVYLAAFQHPRRSNGSVWTPATVLPDRPTEIPGVREADWPQNYDRRFRGEVTLREAVEQSINVPTALVGHEVGIEHVAEAARSLGIRSHLNEFPSLALGASEVNLIEITGAYGGFAAQGAAKRPRQVLAIVDAHGRRIPLEEPAEPPGVGREEAYLVTQLLKGVMQRGTGKAANHLLATGDVAGKSGTTDLYRDAWFVGFTPRRAVGVWVGFDRDQLVGLSGSSAALPIWSRIIEETRIEGGDGRFMRPEGVVTVAIDPTTGMLATGECPVFLEESFRPGTEPTEECTHHRRGLLGRVKRLLPF